MGRPSKQEYQSLVDELTKTSQQMRLTEREISKRSETCRNTYHALRKKDIDKSFSEVPIESLNIEAEGINLSVLKEKGYLKVSDVLGIPRNELAEIPGIGEKMADDISKNAVTCKERVEKNYVFRIQSEDLSDSTVREFIADVYFLMKTKQLKESIESIEKGNEITILEESSKAEAITAPWIKWAFFSEKTKKDCKEAYAELCKIKENGYIEKSADLQKEYENAINTFTPEEAVSKFNENASDFIVFIENEFKLKAIKTSDQISSLSEDIIQEIDEIQLNLSLMVSTLRPYQEFGAKYIINQQRVLLGDEMGLGKTIQAIAAMAHLKAAENYSHFVVVCPVSVMVNWGREIAKHSKLQTITVHGDNRDSLFEEFRQKGGVMITTYETIVRLDLDNCPKINMLTVDEAHYVKNPDAQRTKALRKLAYASDFCLFMTGTPLENKVDEMIFLVSMLDHETSTGLKSMVSISKAPEYRMKVAKVYLRRVRDDVLKELPEKLESEEWVDMTAKELALYAKALMSKNASFKTRKVSYDVEDIADSSKLTRLLEICAEAKADGRKIIVFSFFRSIIEKVSQALGEDCFGIITGSVPSEERQKIIDEFAKAPDGSVIVSQIIAGGVGLNIQCASVVIICEPQWKPSTENQAISRCYRMGQPRSVLVYRLLSAHTVDEDIMEILREKSNVFDNFADESQIDEVNKKLMEEIVEKERARLGITEADLVDDDDKDDGEYDDQEEDVAKEEISSIIDISENKEGD